MDEFDDMDDLFNLGGDDGDDRDNIDVYKRAQRMMFVNDVERFPSAHMALSLEEFVELFEELVKNNSLIKSGIVTSQLSQLFIYKNKIMLVLRKIFSFNIRFKALTLLRRFKIK